MAARLKGWLVVVLLLGTAIYAIAEDITLTTYYPSPRGVYQELKTAGDMVVGDITNPPGARLHVVQEGTAPALRVDDESGDTSPLLVDASGNVGIGTASPLSKLHVEGPGDHTLRMNSLTVNQPGHIDFQEQGVIRARVCSPNAVGNCLTNAQEGDLVLEGTAGLRVGVGGLDGGTDVIVDPAGNVGIGTANPNSPAPDGTLTGNLDVYDVYLRSTGTWASQVAGPLSTLSCVDRSRSGNATSSGDAICAAFGEVCVHQTEHLAVSGDWHNFNCLDPQPGNRFVRCCRIQ